MVISDKAKSGLTEIIGVGIYQFIILIVIIMGLFFFGGIEIGQFFDKTVFYGQISAISMVAMVMIGVVDYLVSTRALSEKAWGWAKLYIHNPEDSILGRITFLKKRLTTANIIHWSIIIGLGFALFSGVSQTFFAGLPPEEFQVTETGKLILETEPASFSETIFMAVFISLIYGFGLWLLGMMGVEEPSSNYLMYIISIVAGTLFWLGFHSNRYGSSELSLIVVLLFAFWGILLTFLFGSIIPWYVWHVFNNIFQKANELFSNETVVFVIATLLISYAVIIVLWKISKALISGRGMKIFD